jgi:replicative DNA helicase
VSKRRVHEAQDHHAELALCGAVFADEGVLDAVDIQPEHFFDPRLRLLWGHMQDLRGRGVALDEVTLVDGAPAGVDLVIAEAAAGGGTSRNAGHYAETVRRHALTRQVLVALSDVVAKHEAGMVEGKDLLDEALATITRIDVGRPGATITIRDVVKARLSELDEINAARSRGETRLSGVTTGIPKLDAHTDGWPLGLVSIVAARPGHGKSAFMLQCTAAAVDAGHGVHVFSFEDQRAAYADRSLSQESGVPGAAIRGQLNRGQLEQLTLGAKRVLARKRWLYEDASALSAEDVVRAVRRSRVGNGTRLAVVDYLQLLRRPKRYETVHDSIFQSLCVLADAARQDDVAYLVGCQLNREVEKRQDKTPLLSDMRGSGGIEERAKVVVGLHRPSEYGPPQKGTDYDPGEREPGEDEWRGRLDVHLLKYSQGEKGYVRCHFDGPTMRITQERDRG